MAFEETREQQQMYNYFRSCIYIFLIIEIIMNLPVTADNRVTQFVLDLLARFRVFNSVSGCKVAELICICIVCIGTKAEKSLKFNVRTMVIYPVLAGLTLVGLCFVFHGMSFGFSWLGFPANRLMYAVCSVVGTMLVHQGLDGIAKYYNYKVGEDRFNFENESFQQSETLVSNDYSVNIPMIYYWKKKMHKGWINIINPFRGTIVLGTPGSGKSFGIIDPFIRQHSAKGFAMMVYDFKYPTLAKTLFYQYCKNRKAGKLPQNCGFRIVNFTDVEYSNRINPIQRKYIPDLAAASETAATLLASLNKGGGEKKGGSEAFFTNSAPGECRCRELYRQAPALQALYRIRGSVPRAYRADVLQGLTAEQACSSYPLLRCTTDGEARFLQDKFCTGFLETCSCPPFFEFARKFFAGHSGNTKTLLSLQYELLGQEG